MNRSQVIALFLEQAREELERAEAGAALARLDATHSESRPENKYDTRSTEASYLAAGQARRVVSLRLLVAFYEGLGTSDATDDAAGMGRLIEMVDDDGTTRWMFMAPDGGGTYVDVDGARVRIVTPDAPLGRQLLDAVVGDGVLLPGDAEDELEIVSVR